jgi:multiple PDZ domain protein
MSKDETVIVIRSLVPGGVASWDGRIVPGDRLMFVNDVDLAHASLDEAVQVIHFVILIKYFEVCYNLADN